MNLHCQTKVPFQSYEGLKGWDKHVQMHPKTCWKHTNLNLPNHFAKGFSTILEFLLTFQRLEQNWTIIKSTTHNKSCIWKMLPNISSSFQIFHKMGTSIYGKFEIQRHLFDIELHIRQQVNIAIIMVVLLGYLKIM